jgi:hypothetical protein
MSRRNISYILPVSIASGMAVLLLVGSGLSSLAQINNETRQDISGTINSLVQEDGETTYIIAGDWNLSLEEDRVSGFSADLVMTGSDGMGAHAHKIVMAGEDTLQLADERSGTVEVTLTPTEQNVGGTILVSAEGLGASNDTVVKIGEKIAGNTQADADGNLLFALGITDDMAGPNTVMVEDETNRGSASFTVIESENLTSAQPGNLTTTENTVNMTDAQSGNVTAAPAGDQTDESTYNTIVQGQLYDSDATQDSATNDTSTSAVDEADNINPGGELTTFEEETAAAGEIFEDLPGFNATASENSTSTDTESSVFAEIDGNNTSFEVLADIYTDDELKWKDVRITVTVMNDQVIMIEIDPAVTENHFGDQPVFGMADT